MKLTFLLLPIIFLSSCTIDGNNGKNETASYKTELENRAIDSNSGITNFGSGFTLSQTNDETIVSYSGKVIKTWSHTPPERVPFVWDDACTMVWEGFEKLTPENQSTGKQGIWDTLTEKEKKECMKEYYGNGSIYISKSQNSRFFKITESYYEGANQWIFDTVSGNLQSFGFELIEYIHDTSTGIEIGANGKKIYTPDFSREMHHQ